MKKLNFFFITGVIARMTVSKADADASRIRFAKILKGKSDSILASIVSVKDEPDFYRNTASAMETDARHIAFFVEAAEEELKARTMEVKA